MTVSAIYKKTSGRTVLYLILTSLMGSFSTTAVPAESLVVALENVEDDLNAANPGNGAAKPSVNGLPTG